MPVVTETYVEFCTRQGGDGIQVDGRILFPSGATSDIHDGQYRTEPPADPEQLLHAQRAYVGAQLQRARKNFDSTKTHLVEMASNAAKFSNLPGPPDDAPAHLQELKKVVGGWNAKLRALDKQLDDAPTRQRRQGLQHQQDERGRQMQTLRSLIQSVSLDDGEESTGMEAAEAETKILAAALAKAAGVKDNT